jgi:hypothetical protein
MKYSISYSLILYILVCISLGATAINFLYKRGQSIGAAILLVLLILVFLFYGLRWFPANSSSVTGQAPQVQWPPIVNMCPDFMVTWTDPASKSIYCYDANNLYNLKTATTSGIATNLTINNTAGQSAYLMKNPTQNTNAVSIATDTGGLRWPFANKFINTPATITANSTMKWEGVWDGANATVANIPLP